MISRTAALTAIALVAFAANSLLCRDALGGGHIDAASFTAVRLTTGALILVLWAKRSPRPQHGRAGSWVAAAALFGYAAAFSLAYLRLEAGPGALILFGTVQATMIGTGLARGEQPHAREWSGLVLAIGGLVWLTLPGWSAPDPAGSALMALAGVAWAVYTLRGRGTTHPVAATAANFVRTVPLAALLLAWSLASAHASARGLLLATASGALASGVGYCVWYAALRHLTAARAAIVQLAVPVLVGVGGILLLGETLTLRLAGAGSAILCGIALAVLPRRVPRTAPR